VLALDMPGRQSKPGDLREMTIADYVDSLVGDIESAGLEDIVIVGHSMRGMTLPGVVTRLGAARVREMIFAAAFHAWIGQWRTALSVKLALKAQGPA
jgi:surfactin synthase thioesterase subunit